jgi:ribosome-associated protein
MSVIRITRHIAIDEDELEERFFHASGPGGQHVNKTATAVQLRFDVAHSPALSDDVRRRLIDLAGSRMTEDGILVIDAQRFRSQRRNRRDARERLVALIRDAAKKPRRRRQTKPSRAAKQRRLEEKRRRSEKKRLRKSPRE